MEPADKLEKQKVKKIPPVPIKTYLWEDVRRARKRGKYPYTHLNKGPYAKNTMDEEKENKPAEGEKKKKVVRKVKKVAKTGDSALKEKQQAKEKDGEKTGEEKNDGGKKDEEKKDDQVKIVEIFEKTEVEEIEIKLKEDPEKPSEHLEKIETDENKTETKPESKLTITTEDRDLSTEKDEGKDVETISPDSDKLVKEKPSEKSTKSEETPMEVDEIQTVTVDISKDTENKTPADDVVSKTESRNTESEDTYTDSNIEQYLDKEEVSKSVSDASGFEATTSVSDVELPTDSKMETLQVQADKKRKHSDESEMTKSNLSLFEKMKNAKFKPPTFKIPKFKKFGFGKRNSKRVKVDPKETKVVAKLEVQRKKSESPVYIYIPLNPTPEELEQERLARLKSSSSSLPQRSSESDNNRLNETKDTNGTVTPTTSTAPKPVDIKSVTSKWKNLQSKTEKKSPPLKKKGAKTGKKASPTSEKKHSEKKSPPVVERRGDSPPVDYIHIPLHAPEPEASTKVNGEVEDQKSSDSKTDVPAEETQHTESKEVIEEAEKDEKQEKPVGKESPKGAIKKKSVKNKKAKDTSTSKLARDIKKIALKLKGVQKKSRKSLSTKKSSIKTASKTETGVKKISPTTGKRRDSPQYIYIPLKGPLPENLVTETGKKNEEISVKSSEDEPTDSSKTESENVAKEDPSKTLTEVPKSKEKEDKSSTAAPKESTEDSKSIDLKKESLISKLKGLKHKTQKTATPAKKTGVKPFHGKQLSPKSAKKDAFARPWPGIRREDSIVEYIHISLKPTEAELAHEAVKKQQEMKAKVKSGATSEHALKSEGGNEGDTKLPGTSIPKENVLSKWKGLKHRAEKKSPPTKKKKVDEEAIKPDEKTPASEKPAENIPLKTPKGQQTTEEPKTETMVEKKEETTDSVGKPETGDQKETKVDTKEETTDSVAKPETNDETTIKSTEPTKTTSLQEAAKVELAPADSERKESSKAEARKSIMSKLKNLKLEQDGKETDKKSDKFKGSKHKTAELAKRGDSPPTEYICIPLKGTESEQDDSTPKNSEVQIAPSEEAKLETPEEIKSDETKSAESAKSEETPQEPKPSKVDTAVDTTAVKQKVSKWKGLKQKTISKSPPTKKKSGKKVSSKSEKKPTAETKRNDPPIAIRSGDSPPVEYIYIPLIPTPEQIQAEKEEEEWRKEKEKKKQKEEEERREKQRLAGISVARTPEMSHKPRIVKEHRKEAAMQGAIKKQSQVQEATAKDKAKDKKSQLTEDIKKFAAKLREMQKKSKKPTFKTFKRGSKVGSKKLSPTTSKKPIGSEGIRAPPKGQKRGDSPVEYIFIPLNPTPEELLAEQEAKKLKEASSASSPKSEDSKPQEEPQSESTQPKPSAGDVTKEKSTEKLSEKLEDIPEVDSKTPSTSSSPFNTLKKTKEAGKAKLKALKDAVQPVKDKISEKTAQKSEKKSGKSVADTMKPQTDKKKDTESPKYIFIPLKGPEQEEKPEEIKETKETKEEAIPTSEAQEAKETVENPAEEPEKDTTKVPHYEPITKEDDEDGLKTAVIKEHKVAPEEQTIKSNLKTEDSPKLNKKVSFKKSLSKDKEHGEPKKEGTRKSKAPQPPVTVDGESKTSLEDDRDKWSKSTDHEYEPINPPPEPVAAAPATSLPEAPPPVHVTTLTDLERKSQLSQPTVTIEPPTPQPGLESRLLRIPLDTELIVPSAEFSEPESERSQSRADTGASSPDTQATYLGTPTHTTVSSRTEGISTSQVDSSNLERLPLRKESRKKKTEMLEPAEPQPPGPNIQEKLKTQAGKLKTKLKSIKKPSFTIPNPKFSPKFKRPKFERPKFQKPNFQKPKFQRPKFEAPKFKMPERPKINFPSFSLPRPGSMRRRPAEDRPMSTTESSAESKKNIFDFRTYPRIFDRTKRKKTGEASAPSDETPEFATVPRAAARKKGPVGARWVHRFSDIKFADEESKKPSNGYSDELESKDRGDSLERRMEADLRYEQALAEADDEMREFERENQDIHRHSPYNFESIEYSDRWRHGNFRRNELDDEAKNQQDFEIQQTNHDEHSSVASSGRHHGVLEEIDSDQFFLREKGISQDNIQVGLYLSSEIRDAFRQPVNALSQMENVQPGYGSREYDLDASDLSLTRPSRPKRKHLKKTKKIKKTPHASQENIPFDQESVNTEPEEYPRNFNDYKTYPPPRPRRHKRPKMLTKEESLEVSQGETAIDDDVHLDVEQLKSQEDLPGVSNESLPNIIGYIDKDIDVTEEYNKYLTDEALMYENEMMKDIEQPEIIINADQKYEIEQKDIDRFLEDTGMTGTPKPPTRRQKSLKSLNLSEHDSILGEFNKDRVMQDILEQELNVYRVEHKYIMPSEEALPVAPTRRTRSRSRTESQVDDDRTSHGAESLVTESECHEPPCQQDIRDAMGYAIIDKSSKNREPPLPSSRKRRSKPDRGSKSPSDTKFFTVPRALNDTPPVRPTRNYSTLGPDRPPRKKSELDLTEEEKENIDISQYIEIDDDDHSRDLQSGEIINKMKGRPLPAPPRPPRKTRDRSEALRDITQDSNIISDVISEHEKTLIVSPASPPEAVEEITVSTQTDPLPDDFCCEEFVEEPTDVIVAPTRRKKSIPRDSSIPRSTERPKTPIERTSSPAMVIEQRVRTPVEDEIITHASLIVKPVPEYPPDSCVSKRFGPDVPDIFSDTLLSAAAMSNLSEPFIDRSIEEISPERHEFLPQAEISEESFLPQAEISEEFTLRPELSPVAAAETTKFVSPEKETVYSEVDDQVPEIPEKPQRRKSQSQTVKPETPQPQIIERIIERQVPVCVTPGPETEVEVLKAQRLQVTDLDVERLNVSELQAHKILVSEIDGVSLQISELSSKTGNLVLNGLEIPSGLIQELLDRLQPAAQQQQPSPSTEQVSTQTSIEEPDPTDSKFTEPVSTEQVATQTSIEIPDESIKVEPQAPPPTEQVATQTSVEEPEDSEVPEEFSQLLDTETVEPLAHSAYVVDKSESVPQEIAALTSPTIVVDPPEKSTEEIKQDEEQKAIEKIKERIKFIEEEMNEFLSDITPDNISELKSEIDTIIDIASEQVRRSQEDLVELMEAVNPSDLYYPVPIMMEDQMFGTDIPGLETDVIFLPPHAILLEEIPDDRMEFMDRIVELPSEDMEIEDKIIELPDEPMETLDRIPDQSKEEKSETHITQPAAVVELKDQKTPDTAPKLETQTSSTESAAEEQKPTDTVPVLETQPSSESASEERKPIDPIIKPETQSSIPAECTSEEQKTTGTVSKLDTQPSETHESTSEGQKKTDTAPIPKAYTTPSTSAPEEILERIKETVPKRDTQTTESSGVTKASELKDHRVPEVQSQMVGESGDSVIPKEFRELKSEQERIMKSLQQKFKVSQVAEPAVKPADKEVESQKKMPEQTESSSSPPTTPPRPPPPRNGHVEEHIPPGQILHEIHYPLSYYSEYMHSMPPQSFYTLRPTHPDDLSEEDIPVHHRRRRHHRQPSRSSSEEDRRTVSRRQTARSPEPSIPQLTGQLARACTVSCGRVIRQLISHLSSSLGTRLDKQDLQIVTVILLILVAGLILLGFGGGKTVHLHHWEYFNPPKEL